MSKKGKDTKTVRLFSSNIKRFRNEKGWSQQQLGLLLGYKPESARNMIYLYETGLRHPDPATLDRMAEVFGKNIADFYNEESAKKIDRLDMEEVAIINNMRKQPKIKREVLLITEALTRGGERHGGERQGYPIQKKDKRRRTA